ncbi:MAG: hypothetical protein D6689_10035 [Deltaproteobacteria bacterium]|nr:MAG: hypothetical protein D6689_10035 [Deltaproteobacteria bacterium]
MRSLAGSRGAPLWPSPSRFRAYLAERFPVPVTAALAAAVAAGAYAAAQADALRAGAPLSVDGALAGGAVCAFLFLFLLRVFDEHKDFEHDAATRPDRPVPRGLVTLEQLRAVGAVAVAMQVAIAAAAGPRAALLYLAVLAYSGLMFVEFFAPAWLSARIGLYAVSHSAVMSVLAVALGARYAASAVAPADLAAYAAAMLPAFVAVDVLRKTWAPEAEIAGVDSYSRRLGVRGAGALGGALLAASAVAGGWVGVRLGGGAGWLAGIAAVTAWGWIEIARFCRRPAASGHKRLETVAGVHALAVAAGPAIAAAVAHGAVWGTP